MHKFFLLALAIFVGPLIMAQNNIGIGTQSPNPNAIVDFNNQSSPLGMLLPRVDTGDFSLGINDYGLFVYDSIVSKLFFWDGSGWQEPLLSSGGFITGSGNNNEIAFWNGSSSLNGNSNFVWDNANGRLGIGTTNPNTTVQVEGTGSFFFRMRSTESNGSAYSELEFGRDNGVGGFFKTGGIGTPGSGDYLQIVSPQFIQFLTNFSPRMTIANNGNVTLGTGANSDLFNINEGNMTIFRSDGNDLELTFNADNNGIPWTIGVDDAANADFIISQNNNLSNPKLFISSGNAVGIGLSNPINRLDVEGGAAIGSGYAGTITAPTNGMVVQGNVGIGTNSPLFPLVVNGQSEINGEVGIGSPPVAGTDLFITSGSYSVAELSGSSVSNFTYAGSGLTLASSNTGSGTPNNDWTLRVGTGGLTVIGQQNISGMLSFRYAGSMGGQTAAVMSTNHFGPYSNAGLDLGSNSFRWNRIYYTTGILGTSDRKYKNNIMHINYGIDEIMRLNPVSFEWNEFPEQGKQLGLIAQEVQTILPEVIVESEGEEKDLMMNHLELIPVLIKGMQELKTENDILKDRIIQLENK